MNDKPHVLHVSEDFEPDFRAASFDLEHHPDCPTEHFEFGEYSGISYLCLVGRFVYEEGIDTFFRHVADTSEDDGKETLAPGTHQIEPWENTWRNYAGGLEWEGGLCVAKPEAGAA
jgi:hypothetical protein